MEEKFPVIDGAEAFHFKGNEIGILISHGFIGTPQSVRFLGEELSRFGYSVLGPRLKGHGTHYLDLEKCTMQDWFSTLEEGYLELSKRCTSIYIIGQSMGGTLALWLAYKYPDIKSLMLINSALTIPALEYLEEKLQPRFIVEGNPDIKAQNVHEIAYPKIPLKAIHELQNLMKITPIILSHISCPILGFKSLEDHVVLPEDTDYIIENIGSKMKEIVVLENSYHVASMDFDKDIIVKECHRFLHQIEQKVVS